MIFGLSVYLFIRITIVSKKLDRLIRDIDDTQNWIRRIQIDICDINKQWEVKRDRDRNRLDRIEDRIGKLASDFNDIIRKKVNDWLASILYGGSPRSVAQWLY